MVQTKKHMHSTNSLFLFLMQVLYNFTTVFVQEIN